MYVPPNTGYLNGVGGYYAHGMGPYMDFHECSNNTDHGPDTSVTGVFRGAPAEAHDVREVGKYNHVFGAMPLGYVHFETNAFADSLSTLFIFMRGTVCPC